MRLEHLTEVITRTLMVSHERQCDAVGIVVDVVKLVHLIYQLNDEREKKIAYFPKNERCSRSREDTHSPKHLTQHAS